MHPYIHAYTHAIHTHIYTHVHAYIQTYRYIHKYFTVFHCLVFSVLLTRFIKVLLNIVCFNKLVSMYYVYVYFCESYSMLNLNRLMYMDVCKPAETIGFDMKM